ncbi:flagellar hook assembly protein FlgD [Aquabacter sp. L1I39]|uniref:flagellar hook assembly protein FlgD n=1 Tax=Aquabacter sp. L1I39 TaxID=2820278 RepID=UPI001AD9A9F9|nr:flagellar hook assembly protein FlgD [Aquabacter sp. L1I39]QTL04307.1 flagellar hook assembly protein FlgD [Aquabacter sp. L1I39]
MTTISNVTGSTASSATASAAAAKSPSSIDYTAFLRLLVAQLQNQDPTQPMDSTAYMSQLASFSQVEQSVASNAKLDSLLAATSLQTAERAVGRTVTSADGTVSGEISSVRVTSGDPVATLTDGQTVTLSSGIVLR